MYILFKLILHYQGPNLNFIYFCEPQLFNLLLLYMKFLQTSKMFGSFYPFLFTFNTYWQTNYTFKRIFSITLFSVMFLSKGNNIQGPQKQVGGSHFGHALSIPITQIKHFIFMPQTFEKCFFHFKNSGQ